MNRRMRRIHVITAFCLTGVLLTGVAGAVDDKASPPTEQQLIKTIQGNASQAEKDLACRRLQVIGTEACIDALAGLLTDKKLSHMARVALEPMSSPKAALALRGALGKTSGATKIGLIISLGFRRDTASTGVLTELLKDKDNAVAGAAAAALGRIGTPQAARALGAFRKNADKALKITAAEASLTAAEQLARDGKQAEAAKICEDLQAARWPAHVRLGAFVGLLSTGGQAAVDLAVAAISGKDVALRLAAISNVSKLKGEGVGKRLAAELDKLPPGAQGLLIDALGDLGDASILPTIVKAAQSNDAEVRGPAIEAIGKIGDVNCVKLLGDIVVAGKSGAEQQAAVNSLHGLKGDKVNSTLVAFMKSAPPKARARLMEALITRKASESVGYLVKEAKSPEARVRLTAIKALGWIAQPEDLEALVALAVKPVDETARSVAEVSIVRVARKIADESARGEAVLAALKTAGDTPAKCSLLRVLGSIGGKKAFAAVEPALKDKGADVQDAAVHALSNWPGARALDPLMNIAKTSDNPKHRVLSLRGCVRILGLNDCTVQRTLASYRELIKASKTPADTKLVLSGLGAVADPAALELIEPFLARKEFLAEAEFAKLGVARAIMGSSSQLARKVAASLTKSKSRTVTNQANWILRSLSSVKPDAVSAGSWKSLFNGKDLTGWRTTGNAIFKVEDGCLVCTQTTGKGGDIWTDAEYDNFELRVTYRVVWPSNSGFWFRYANKKGYQYDVLKYKRPVAFSGSLYCHGKMFLTRNLKESLENRDGWNKARIRAMGQDLTLWLNGTRTGKCTDDTMSKGRIGIQVHPGNSFKGMQMIVKTIEIRTLTK